MSSITINKIPVGVNHKEMIKINLNEGTVTAGLNIVSFIDKDTKQYVLYSPSVEVSAYGETEQKANEMMGHAIQEFFKFLLSIDKSGIDAELTKLGWEHNTIFKKEYLKAYVDSNGDLRGFNAEENSIKHLTLTAA